MLASERFVEEMGLMSQEQGSARISGRILGLLIIEGRELSLGQISERLAVSRASVSTNARQLARVGAIQRTSHKGDRQDYYVVSEVPDFDILGELADRFARHARRIANCVAEMRAENEAAAERAEGVQSVFEKSADVFRNWAMALRDEPAAGKDKK